MVSIMAFFVFVLIQTGGVITEQFLIIEEVQWIIQIILFTCIGFIVSIPYGLLRKRTDNLFLEMGYVAIGIGGINDLYLHNRYH